MKVAGIVGWFGSGELVPRNKPEATLQQLVAALPSPPLGSTSISANAAIAAAGGACTELDGTIQVALTGRPYWRGDARPHGRSLPEMADAFAAAYRAEGHDCVGKLGGEFGLALYDESSHSGFVAVDRFARFPLYWTESGGALVFGSSADAVLAFPGLARALNPQGLFNYAFFHMVPAPGTIYRGIRKLRGASLLRYSAQGVSEERYWTPQFSEGANLDVPEAGKRLLGLVESAVRRQQGTGEIGAFLSGGLDSSTVAGVLARTTSPADTYSIGFDAEGYDEMPYARHVVEHFGLRSHEYYVTPDDVLQALPQIAAAYDEPFGNSSALPAYFCARRAVEDGKTLLLGGDGGDELFAGNARYLKQQVFEIYGRVPALLRRGVLEPLIFKLPGSLPLVNKARSYIEQAKVPLPDRLQAYNFILRLGAEAMFEPDFLAQVQTEAPWQIEREIYKLPSEASALNRMLFLDWQHTLADNDLRKVTRMCELAGVGVTYPLLDDGVVDFSLTVPSRQKIRGNRLRDFYKECVRGFLPEKILTKTKHGFGLPFGVWTAQNPALQALAQDNLQRFARRGILKASFIEEALRLHREGHAGYYGELIWVLMILELWLTSRGFEP